MDKTIAYSGALGYGLMMTRSNPPLQALFDTASPPPQRLAKRIAASGLCSRRDAEAWIKSGRVTVNGATHTTPAFVAQPDDAITVDGTPLVPIEPPRLWRYYKPRGVVVSRKDEKGRKTLFDGLPKNLPRLISVGRLDMDSEGLILLTNSGALARHLELPSTGWSRKYRVRVRGVVDGEKLGALQGGITLGGIRYRGITAQIDHQGRSNAWLTLTLTEGKNREIRRIMEHLGYRVNRLIRVSFGPFGLHRLEVGDLEEIRDRVLWEQLGLPSKQGEVRPKKPQKKKIRTHKKSQKPTPKSGGKNAHHQRHKTRRSPHRP